jgi:hypothetical protein
MPVTNVELEHPGSTRNLFDLPTHYNYGVGSAGFGAQPELDAHLRTTRWVLEGAIEGFPILYHHRLVPVAGQTRVLDGPALEDYIAYWDGDDRIRRFVAAREESKFAIALFVEHIPHVLQDWLPVNEDAVHWVIDDAIRITEFLRGQDAAHLDAHLSNVLTDGTRLYFADFGLFLDSGFDLSIEEQMFLADRRHFDIAEFITALTWPGPGVDAPAEPGDSYLDAVQPFGDLIEEISGVFERLATGPKTDGRYDGRQDCSAPQSRSPTKNRFHALAGTGHPDARADIRFSSDDGPRIQWHMFSNERRGCCPPGSTPTAADELETRTVSGTIDREARQA